MNNIRLLIGDDVKLIREGLKIILERFGDIEVVGMAQVKEEALALCQSAAPQVVLMDIRRPGCDGVEAARRIHARHQDIQVLILTTFSDMDYIEGALRQGAAGYLYKDSAHNVIYEAIKAASRGSIVVPPAVARQLLSHVALQKFKGRNRSQDLTAREITFIRLGTQGLSNKEISRPLFWSEGSVKKPNQSNSFQVIAA
ncbi:hypothetical protein ABB02_00168 [Clostridiaceae bacterium JG1575]|nr:hypothetical protein ABB02_00168 [Clostridiaceae bacterium JG1575]